MDNFLDLIKLVLPPFLVDHFEIVKRRKEKEVLHLYFEERNLPPKEFLRANIGLVIQSVLRPLFGLQQLLLSESTEEEGEVV